MPTPDRAPAGARAGLETARLAVSFGAVGQGGGDAGTTGRAASRHPQRGRRSQGQRRALCPRQMCYDRACTLRRSAVGRGTGGRPQARRRPPGPASLQRRLRRGAGRRRQGEGRTAPGRRREDRCAARPSTGSRPSWRSGPGTSKPAHPRPGRSSSRPSLTGSRTPTWPEFARRRRLPSYPRRSGRRAGRSGRMWTSSSARPLKRRTPLGDRSAMATAARRL